MSYWVPIFSVNVCEPACGGSDVGVDDLNKRKTDAENVALLQAVLMGIGF